MKENTDKDRLENLLRNIKELPETARKDLEAKIPEYTKLIHKMARKYVRNRVEYDDLVQEALIGLTLACRDFDPSRSNDFHTYAIYRMRGKMYEYCIGNESPIYVPTHIAKAGSYVKQMQRLLDKQPDLSNDQELIRNIIRNRKHEAEDSLPENVKENLSELKRKLGSIARNSRAEYERLAGMAMESLSMVVSDDVLAKYPEEAELVEESVSNREVSEQFSEILGDKKFTVVSMVSLGWSYREIAEELEKKGYVNRKGEQISRQAVKAILDEALKDIKKTRLVKSLRES